MSKINEILTSVVLYSLFSYLLNLPNFEYGLLLAVLGSQINMLFPKNYKHSLVLYIPLSILTIVYPVITVPLMIGYFSSILIALMSKDACKLLYPVNETTFTGPKNYLENNTKEDHAATAFLITLVVISLLLSFNGTEIVDHMAEKNSINTYFEGHENKYEDSPESVHYVNINPSYCLNKNITTIKTENTTTTLITRIKKEIF